MRSSLTTHVATARLASNDSAKNQSLRHIYYYTSQIAFPCPTTRTSSITLSIFFLQKMEVGETKSWKAIMRRKEGALQKVSVFAACGGICT